MKKPGKKKPMGRPPIEIDWEEFDKLCGLQCTRREIAGWFNCSEDTIENKVQDKFGLSFSAYFEQKGAKGKISLRRRQFQAAMEGNVSMLIWLGKQWLGQSEKAAIEEPKDPPSFTISGINVPTADLISLVKRDA